MTLLELARLWRARWENPLARLLVRRIVLPVMASAMLPFGCSLVLLRLAFPFQLVLLPPILVYALLVSLGCHFILFPRVAPRACSEDQLEELLLTRLSREEVAFGLVYAPMMAALLCITSMVLGHAAVSAWILVEAGVAPTENPVSIILLIGGMLWGMSMMAAMESLRFWQENPTRTLRNALASLVRTAYIGVLCLIAITLFISLLQDITPEQWFGRGSEDFLLVVRWLVIFLGLSLLGVALVRALASRLAVRRSRTAKMSALIGAALLVVGLISGTVKTLSENDLMPLMAPVAMLLLLAAMIPGFLRFMVERTLCRVYPEEYQEACWSAPDDPRHGRWRDRVTLVLPVLRLPRRGGIILEVAGILLATVVLLAVAGLTALLAGAIARSRVAGADMILHGIGGFTTTLLIATVLTAVRIWSESRLRPGGRIPVVRGAILSGAFVYAVIPWVIALGHGLVVVGGFDRGGLSAFLFMAPISLVLALAVALALMPARRRWLWYLPAIALPFGFHMLIMGSAERISWAGSRAPVYYPHPGPTGEWVLMLGSIGLILLMLFGLTRLAQRVHDSRRAKRATAMYRRKPVAKGGAE